MSESSLPPQQPASLPGSIWGITTFFNPVRYGNKRQNFRLFRESLRRQGLPLIVVELVHDDAPFELDNSDAEIVVQRRGGAVLWQKERLLNIATGQLPADCDKVVWLDADVLFLNRHWIADTSALLEQYVFVQPFSLVFRLPEGCTSPIDRGKLPRVPGPSSAYLWSRDQARLAGEPGFAMAVRRSILKSHGLYDRMILGGGDRAILGGVMGIDPVDNVHLNTHPDNVLADVRQWSRDLFTAARGSLYYTEGNLLHLWHGRLIDRGYGQRTRLLKSFDVREDIRLDSQGLCSWATDKPALHEAVREYFLLRNEDGQRRSVRPQRVAGWLRKSLRSLVPQRLSRFLRPQR